MTRNQWIGAGCGGAGCLGLIVVLLAGAFVYWSYRRPPAIDNFNSNSSHDSDHNSNTTNSEPRSSSSMSEDNRHKLFQAASTSQDNELMKKVSKKLGLLDADGNPGKAYAEFVKDHVVWIFRNTDWITEYNTPEKARTYVNEHIND
jgi:cytoskeletal protein RodZ